MNDFKISVCMGNTPFVTGYNIVGVIQTFILLSFLFSLVTFFFLLLPQTTPNYNLGLPVQTVQTGKHYPNFTLQ